jgi:integrase
MATIEKRAYANGETTYRAKIRIKGRPIQTANFKRKTDAKKWAQATETAIEEKRYFSHARFKNKTFGDMIDRYIEEALPLKPKAKVKQTQQLTYWKEQLGYMLLSDVSSPDIVDIRNKLSRGTTPRGIRSHATVNRYLAALSHVYTIAIKEWEWTHDNPVMRVSKLKESRGRTRFLSDEERCRLLNTCQQSENKYLYIIVVLALSTGARRNEINTLKWHQIDFTRQIIRLDETKNGERRVLPLQGYAYELVYDLSKKRNTLNSYLFPSVSVNKPVDITKSWNTALKKAHIEDFRFHDLRHSAASYLAMDGASITDIAEVLGHKTLQMAKRYSHLSEAHTKGVVASMNQKIFSDRV